VDLEVLQRLRGQMVDVATEWGRLRSTARSGLDGFGSGDFGEVFGRVRDDYNTYAPRLLEVVEVYGTLLDGAADDVVATVRTYRDSDEEARARMDSFEQGIDEPMASIPLWWDV
jgi:hypothetical protein